MKDKDILQDDQEVTIRIDFLYSIGDYGYNIARELKTNY